MTTETLSRTAPTDHAILEVLAERWSPRAFTEEPVDPAAVDRFLEAARWAPSCANSQPSRFLVAQRGTESFDKIVATMDEGNQAWAPRAGVLIAGLAKDVGTGPYAGYDLGQAVAHLSVQAHADGLHVHQMAGFSPEALTAAFELGEDLTPTVLIAVGHLDSPEVLAEPYQSRETAERVRLQQSELVLLRD